MPKNDDVFIKYYETIRQMLHQLFVYGCYDREQGARRQGTSDRSYSTNLRRARYFWPGDLAADRSATKKKIHRFPLPSSPSQGNLLARSYAIKAFNDQDINLYVFLLSALADGGARTIVELLDLLNAQVFTDYGDTPRTDAAEESSRSDEQDPVYYPMVRDKLDAMVQAGFLKKQDAARNARYQLAEDVLDRLSSDELACLDRAVMRWRDRLPLASLGYSAQRVIEDALVCCRGDEPPKAVLPAREGVFFQSVLDDELAFEILAAIEHRRCITFSVERDPDAPYVAAVPLRILRDMVYGRQYLFARTSTGDAFIRRLDLIHSVEETAVPFDLHAAESVLPLLDHIWCASLHISRQLGAPVPVIIDIRLDGSPKAARVRTRLLRERRMGTIERVTDDHWIYRADVHDPVEMIPWIRTFGRRMLVRTPASLRDRLVHDARKLRASYAAGDFSFPVPDAPRETPSVPSSAHETAFFTEFRNAYFFAVLELYDRMILDGATFTADTLLHELSRQAFALPPRSCDCDRFAQRVTNFASHIRRPALFRTLPDGQLVPSYGYACAIEKAPVAYGQPLPFLLTTLEKRWLMALLEQPAVRDELGHPLVQKIEALLSCEPFPFRSFVLPRGVAAEEPAPHAVPAQTAVHLLIQSIHGYNEVERAFMLFSTWEKEGWLDDATGRYHLILRTYSDEQAALIEKILSLGPAVMVLAPAALKKAVLAALPS